MYEVLYSRGTNNSNNRGNQMIERKELLEDLMQIRDINELRLIRSAVSDRIKEVASAIKYDLDKGDKVIIDSPRRELKEEGTIVKINRTRAVVNISGKDWNVPFSMITKS